jgi:hypothetical protein
MEFRVSPQSIIDIITNSSTEIYTFPSNSAQELIEKIVNSVLKTSGSTLKCKDIFDINLVPSASFKEDFAEWLQYTHPESMEADISLNPKDAKEWITNNPEKAEALMREYRENSDKYSYNNTSEEVEVRTKDGADTGIANMIAKVFDAQEVNN